MINFEGDFIKIKLEVEEVEEGEVEGGGGGEGGQRQGTGNGRGKRQMDGEGGEYILKASNHNSQLLAISQYNGPDNAWKLFKQNPGVFNHFYC